MQQQFRGLLPPETARAFNITWYQENCHGYLCLAGGGKPICIVIVVSIIEGQGHKWAAILPLCSMLPRLVEFFQRGFKMEHPVVLPEVEELLPEVLPVRVMV